jgi:hypothetical protein
LFQLVGSAYSTIRIADLSLYLGLGEGEAGEMAVRAGWTWDRQTGTHRGIDRQVHTGG